MKKGSIDPAFKKLKKAGYLVGKAEYEIPIPKISDVIDLLKKRQQT
jgi:DNA-binding PadR family transcriptional regulator